MSATGRPPPADGKPPARAGAANDPDLDARLQAALRHAPDADLAVPPLVRARIVAAAQRSAVQARLQQPWWKRLVPSWNPWQMGGAGSAVAAVLAATVLWVGRDEQPAAPDPRRADSAMVTRSAPAVAPADAPRSTATPGAASASPRPHPLGQDAAMATATPPSTSATPAPAPVRPSARDTEALAERAAGGRPAPAAEGRASPAPGSPGTHDSRDAFSARRAPAPAVPAARATADAAAQRQPASPRSSEQTGPAAATRGDAAPVAPA